jgi:hypothetical protein
MDETQKLGGCITQHIHVSRGRVEQNCLLHHPTGLAGARNLVFGGPGAVRGLKAVKQVCVPVIPSDHGVNQVAELR